MSVTLSNVTYPPRPAINKGSNYRKKESDEILGEYRQIVIDGTINYDEEEWDVEWIPMIPATGRALETILFDSSKGTSNYLYWQGVGEDTSKYYIATNISRKIVGPGLVQISATLGRVFPTI